MLLRIPVLIFCTTLQFPLLAATFTVNDISDNPDANPGDGVCDIPAGGPPRCSLRAAIMEANASPIFNQIEFSVAGRINVSGSPLPTITVPLTIDATTAPGYNSAAASTLDAQPSVFISGTGLTGTTADGLRSFNIDAVWIKGLGIVNFPDNGIEIVNGEAPIIDSNWIGVGPGGGVEGNDGHGVFLNNADGAIVGRRLTASAQVDRGNVISNNAAHGIRSLLSSDAVIAGNYIGADPLGSADFGNGLDGIRVVSDTNRIGGSLSGEDRGNVIENNGGAGIFTESGGQRIDNNRIRFNQGGGIVLNGSSSTVGFTFAASGNLVTENAGHGVVIGSLSASSNNTVRFLTSASNSGRGLWVVNGSNNELRDSAIGGNSDDAVRSDGSGTQIIDNQIGLLPGLPVGNAANGVVIAGSNHLVQGNRIGLVDDDGVDVVSGSGNQISNNSIGVNTGSTDIGVGNAGVRVRNGPNNTVVSYNRIGFNFDGVALEGSGSRVCGNEIGVDSDGGNIGNLSEGVRVDGGGNRIGDLSAGCDPNLIGFNGSDGVQISGDANIVRGNLIGGMFSFDYGNGNGGVLLGDGADLNLIEGNRLHHNGNDGIRVGSGAGTRNRFENNEFGENGDMSIDLADNGPTANDPGDGDSGPNNLQNYPVITALASVGGQLQVSYRVDSTLASSNFPLTVDFYIEENGRREISRFHRDLYNVTPNSVRTILVNPPFPVSFISAMVIDSEGNSSELSPGLAFEVEPPPDELFRDRFEAP